MKTEQLMKPRVKVELPYPFSPWEVGEILVMDENKEWLSIQGGYCGSDKRIVGEEIESYPHLFRKLEWWQEREPSELPEYIKFEATGHVVKLSNCDLEDGRWWGNGEVWPQYTAAAHEYGFYLGHATPATLSEYTAYINQAKPKVKATAQDEDLGIIDEILKTNQTPTI